MNIGDNGMLGVKFAVINVARIFVFKVISKGDQIGVN